MIAASSRSPASWSGTVIGGRFARHLDNEVRLWLTVALGTEVVLLVVLAMLAGTGVLDYHDNGKLILIAGLAVTFGAQNAAARQFGVQELSTTVLTSTIVGIGVDSRLAGGSGEREKLRYTVVVTMCAGAVVGATMTRWTVAPVIALGWRIAVAASLAVFRYGPRAGERDNYSRDYAHCSGHRRRPRNRQDDRESSDCRRLGCHRRGAKRGRCRSDVGTAAGQRRHPRRHRRCAGRRAARGAARTS